jgi:hypothetical protein
VPLVDRHPIEDRGIVPPPRIPKLGDVAARRELRTAQCRRERAPLDAGGNRHTGEIQHRRRHVDQRHRLRNARDRAAARVVDDQRDAQHRLEQ